MSRDLILEDSGNLKLQRGKNLTNILDLKVSEYLNSNPGCITTKQIDAETFRCTLNVRNQPPQEFGLLFGEILHNYRSSLDSAMFNLVKLSAKLKSKRINDLKISFPIKNSHKAYIGEDPTQEWHQGVLSEDTLIAIEQTQYYFMYSSFVGTGMEKNIRKDWPLNRLRDLSNIDKHRTLRLLFCNISFFSIQLSSGELTNSKFLKTWPWDSGEEIYEFQVRNLDVDSIPLVPSNFAVGLSEDIQPLQLLPIQDLARQIAQKCEWALSIIEIERQLLLSN